MKQALGLVMLLALAGCKKGDKKQGGADPTAPAAKPTAPIDAAPPRARGPEIHVVLESNPSGAMVSMDGRSVGKTPITEPTEGDGREHVFLFHLLGYDDSTVKMMLMRDGVVTGILHAHAVLDGGH